MGLSLRLQAVCDMVTAGNRVADVGCDHGYVAIYLVENGICPSAIAMDINLGPLLRAKKHIEEAGFTKIIESRLSDGLSSLKEKEADTLICAGMGGRLTIKIIKDGNKVSSQMKEFILQPQSDIYLVRQFLRENGYSIEDENMVLEEGKFYPILRVVFKKNNTKMEEKDLTCTCNILQDKFGPVLLQKRHPVLLEYLKQETEKYIEILQTLSSVLTSTSKQTERVGEIQNELKDIEEAVNRYFL
jgi:tRNA (adenine22-N1)-methyltransferase